MASGKGSYQGHIFNRLINGNPIKSVDIKPEHTIRTVMRLVNILNCLAYDFPVIDGCCLRNNSWKP